MWFCKIETCSDNWIGRRQQRSVYLQNVLKTYFTYVFFFTFVLLILHKTIRHIVCALKTLYNTILLTIPTLSYYYIYTDWHLTVKRRTYRFYILTTNNISHRTGYNILHTIGTPPRCFGVHKNRCPLSRLIVALMKFIDQCFLASCGDGAQAVITE